MKKLPALSLAALGIFFVGLLLIFKNPVIIGAFAGAYSYDELSFIGISLIMLSVSLMIMNSNLERKIMQLRWLKQRRMLQERRQKLLAQKTQISLSDAIGDDSGIQTLSEQALHDQYIKRDIEHLRLELKKGNLQAGKGKPGHIEGTSIFYLRSRNGGRLYYQQVDNGYKIVAESGKGNNQDKVITRLRELYSARQNTGKA